MSGDLIETQGLTVFYGSHRGIRDVDLTVRQGEVFGFLGPNGAGKTTTMRVLLDIIRPTRGRASLFGLDCQRDGVAIRKRVAYVPGELALYGNLTGRRYLDTLDRLRGRRAAPFYRRELCDRLGLDTTRRVAEYSQGNKKKLSLVAAFMAKPDLLILDEPTGGLDPLVQQTVLRMVQEARREGRTVFFSSHILSEVQAISDRVGIIREGRLVTVERVDDLTAQPFHRLRLSFAQQPPAEAFQIAGVTELDREGPSVRLEVRENLAEVMRIAAAIGITDMETQPVTLEEVFLAYYGEKGVDRHGQGA
ncbi:MAG: ABC transporter ATP-binding protein [Chloroflexi bacterium]|nr:ABC transporter ATP-binding protein [Chloroflexota bacterium]